MTSIRQALNATNRAVSLRQAAREARRSAPVSLRELVGAPPPGRQLRKVISFDLLQRKLDEFLNQRSRPPFKVRLDGSHYGASTATVTFDDPVHGYDHDPFLSVELAGPGEVLEFDGIVFGTHRFYLRDVNSESLTLNLTSTAPVVLEAVIRFETGGGTEIVAEGFPNIDLEGFTIRIKFQLGPDIVKHTLQLVTFPEWITADVSVDVSALPDGKVASKIEGVINGKVASALAEHLDQLGPLLNRWLLGGDFFVLSAFGAEGGLTVDYILPRGQLEPFPEDPQPPLEPGRLATIDHIVVLMMENRSFDHMLGYLSKEGHADGARRADIDGLKGGEKNRFNGRDYPSFPLPDTRFDQSPCHRHACVFNQVDGGKMDGFVASFAESHPEVGPDRVMGYHTAHHVPVFDALAREFLVCQRWFAAHPGPTFPNRFYTLTGRLNRTTAGTWQFDNPSTSELAPVATRTLFDHLTDRGVTWRYYERGYCFLRLFGRYTTDTQSIVDAGNDSSQFVADALAGNLPSVTFIDPDFIDVPPGYDDGPPADIARGQHFIGRIVNALVQGPLWPKTLLLITYDEHGGFFDHVPPPAAAPVSITPGYGCRPWWCPRGSIAPPSATSSSTTRPSPRPSRAASWVRIRPTWANA
jgi:hypothetical protein